MVYFPERCLERLQHRLDTLETNPYRYDPVRLRSKRQNLMDYVYADNPIKKIRSLGYRYILFVVIFESILLCATFFS